MDVQGREKSEKELKAVLLIVWREFSKTRDPETLTQENLEKLLKEHAQDAIWAVWIRAHRDLLEEFGKQQDDDNALFLIFLLFFDDWRRDLSGRWITRVNDWKQSHDAYQSKPKPKPSLPIIQRPEETETGHPVTNQPTSPSKPSKPVLDQEELPESIPHDSIPLPWDEAKDEIVQEYDAEREAVTTVTATHTDGEKKAASTIGSGDVVVIPFWMTEPGACDQCEPKHGKRARDFPPLHPNCRCYIEWREMIS